MKITLSKHQFNLLTKRNAASEAAATQAKTAQLISQQAVANAEQSRAALMDVVTYLSLADGKAGEYASFGFGSDDNGECFLELIEQPKA